MSDPTIKSTLAAMRVEYDNWLATDPEACNSAMFTAVMHYELDSAVSLLNKAKGDLDIAMTLRTLIRHRPISEKEVWRCLVGLVIDAEVEGWGPLSDDERALFNLMPVEPANQERVPETLEDGILRFLSSKPIGFDAGIKQLSEYLQVTREEIRWAIDTLLADCKLEQIQNGRYTNYRLPQRSGTVG